MTLLTTQFDPFFIDSILFSLIKLNVISLTHGHKIEGDEAPKREKKLVLPLKPYWLTEISIESY